MNGYEFCSLENFYKVFGKPRKTQFTKSPILSILGEYVAVADAYILWYVCKDDNVRIAVDAYAFDEGWVRILDLNIF